MLHPPMHRSVLDPSFWLSCIFTVAWQPLADWFHFKVGTTWEVSQWNPSKSARKTPLGIFFRNRPSVAICTNWLMKFRFAQLYENRAILSWSCFPFRIQHPYLNRVLLNSQSVQSKTELLKKLWRTASTPLQLSVFMIVYACVLGSATKQAKDSLLIRISRYVKRTPASGRSNMSAKASRAHVFTRNITNDCIAWHGRTLFVWPSSHHPMALHAEPWWELP